MGVEEDGVWYIVMLLPAAEHVALGARKRVVSSYL